MAGKLIYRLILWLVLPFVLFRLIWRGWRQRGYWRHLGERFGRYTQVVDVPVIWLHAVSVGETRALIPLVSRLRQDYPQYRLLLTHGTPTGRATGAQLFGAAVWQAYLPYDYAFAVRRFVRHYRPVLGMLMETEIWPNLLAACARQQVPMMLVNARLSARSARRYRYLGGMLRTALTGLCAVAAQSDADAARLQALGARMPQVIGNLKYDIEPPTAQLEQGRLWRAGMDGSRKVWLAASTREGEEALVLDAWQRMHTPQALLVIVPRHPQRFDGVARLLQQRGIRFQRRSDGGVIAADTQVWLGDSMGELFAYYALADLALIGGSLLPFGGQNLIEAAAVGCPVIVGAHRWNFSEASRAALACGAAMEIADIEALPGKVDALLADEPQRARMRAAALQYSHAHHGATARLMPMVAACLGERRA